MTLNFKYDSKETQLSCFPKLILKGLLNGVKMFLLVLSNLTREVTGKVRRTSVMVIFGMEKL